MLILLSLFFTFSVSFLFSLTRNVLTLMLEVFQGKMRYITHIKLFHVVCNTFELLLWDSSEKRKLE